MTQNPRIFDVVVIGAVCIDTNIYLADGDIDFSVEANFSENIDYIGCAGGYSSRAFTQLGYKTAFIGYLGDDHNGKRIHQEFKKDGITSIFFLDPQGTKRSINFMYSDGRRKNFYDGKGSMDMKPDLEKCREILSQTNLIHVNIVNWSRYLLPLAKELGITISCDIQDVVDANDVYRKDYINHADILFFSCVNNPDPTPLIKIFQRSDPERIIVVGMGAQGCALAYRNEIKFYPPVTMAKPVIDTNGAGDSLAVGFLSSYCLDGYKLEDSVLRGQIAARYTCTIKASSSVLINKPKLNTFYERIKSEQSNKETIRIKD
ncbi:MAG: carbohydrate kinase family protein [Promethearchaeota archaeon]